MKIKDILDMETYLAERCHCPNEIYESNGFIYQLFYADSECKLLEKNEDYYAIIAKPEHCEEKDKAQLIIIYKAKEEGKVADTVRCDATKNNITIFKKILSGVKVSTLKEQDCKLNEYVKDSTEKALSKVFEMADAIIID